MPNTPTVELKYLKVKDTKHNCWSDHKFFTSLTTRKKSGQLINLVLRSSEFESSRTKGVTIIFDYMYPINY